MKYIAIPILVYVPADIYIGRMNESDICRAVTNNLPSGVVALAAEDFKNGEVDSGDYTAESLSADLAEVCPRSKPATKMIPCTACEGRGEWETECCNGAGGCDCKGERVNMGVCNVCGGNGEIPEDAPPEQLKANLNAIRGLCFIGAGPSSGLWGSSGTRGHMIRR